MLPPGCISAGNRFGSGLGTQGQALHKGELGVPSGVLATMPQSLPYCDIVNNLNALMQEVNILNNVS